MPKLSLNGMTLAYELIGRGTQTIVWTPSGISNRMNLRSYLIAGHFCENYRVLLWDPRNICASDLRIEDAPSEIQLWTGDMHGLLQALDLGPAYFGGSSTGHAFSLLMAHCYPQDVKGLILMDTPVDAADSVFIKSLMATVYYRPADIAEQSGMEAVLDNSRAAYMRMVTGTSKPEDLDWAATRYADTVRMNPGNRQRLLNTDPVQFAAFTRKWADWEVYGRFSTACLSDEEMSRITAPALVLHGLDPVHPRYTAEVVHRLLPNADWVEYTDHFSQEVLDQLRASDAQNTEKDVLLLPIIASFLRRVEAT
jgi:2-hydroxy-6-oxonona-2,4-dienedioate hydrolase